MKPVKHRARPAIAAAASALAVALVWAAPSASAAEATPNATDPAGAATALAADSTGQWSSFVYRLWRAPATDLSANHDPFERATMRVTLVQWPFSRSSGFSLEVSGIDRAVVGQRFGAHLHDGPCVAGQPALAGPHYNASTADPPVVNNQTEVWLDFTVRSDGTARSSTSVPFRPRPGRHSVVIHEKGTDHTGAAGARLACLPTPW